MTEALSHEKKGNIEQAIQRSHPNKGNKGHEAANACLYLLD